MKNEPFTKTVQRFSIRKYSIGVASVFLGSVLFGSGTVQAEETQSLGDQSSLRGLERGQETGVQPLVEESAVVYSAAASLDVSVSESSDLPSQAVAVKEILEEEFSTASVLESAPVLKEGAIVKTGSEGQQTSSSVEEEASVVQPPSKTTQVSLEKEAVPQSSLGLRIANPVRERAALLAAEVPSTGLKVPIDLTVNGFTANVLDPNYIVEIYGGTYFDRFANNGNQVILRQIDWNKFKGTGFSTEYKREGNSGNYMLWFENPAFYNNIESIKLKTDSIYNVDEAFTPSENNQVWTIPVLKRFVSFPDDPSMSSDATSFSVTITLKNGKTLSELVGNQAVTFGSTFVSGDNYDSIFNINRIVLDTLNGAWFAAEMSNYEAALADTTVDSIFSDTKNQKTESSQTHQEISELLPIVTENGQVTGFKFITRYELVKGRSVLTEPAGTIPYIVQKLPQELMNLVDTNQVHLYASNAGGTRTSQAIPLVVNQSGLVNTKDTPAISLEGVTSQQEADSKRQKLVPIFTPIIEEVKMPSVTLSGYYEPAAYTIEYNLQTPLSREAFATVIDGIAQKTGASALAETWKERGVYSGSNQATGIMRNTYSNTYMDRSILNVENKLVGSMRQADLYEIHYLNTEVQVGKSGLAPQTGQIPRGTSFKVLTNNASQVTFDNQGTATITLPETERLGETVYTVLATYPDGSTDRKVLTVNRISATKEEADSYNPSYDGAGVQAGDQVVLTGKDLPATATYSVTGSGMTVDNQGRVTVVVPSDASTGSLSGSVTIRYSDGS
ncbi:Rib/alpha-like domain-containing protein, partial [Streptococcus danieliae]|uniref:Rib/alpha-like domain-containing protein n=1 Tax=Streptococcus danieliae TaxID=747656 RepID=UPI0021C66279